MKRFPFKSAVAAAAFGVLLFQGGPAALSQSCVQYTGSFSENFSTVNNIDVPDSSVKYWCTDPTSPSSKATLNKLGGNFTVQNPTNTPSWLNTLTANDFDGDGWPDFVGTSSSYSNCLVFVKNMGGQGQVGTFKITLWIDGSQGDSSGNPVAGVGGAALDTEGNCSITSGDYDGDGDIDFLYVCSTTASGFGIKRVWLYRNTLITNGVNTGTLGFQQVDLTAALAQGIDGIAWSATSMISLDIDKDGDIDVLIGNKDGNVLKLTNTGNKLINSQTFYLEPTPIISTGWGGRGVSTVSAADFRGAGVLDIIVGSVSNNVLNHYANDGSGHFTLYQSITYYGAATVSLAADFNQNGTQDLIIGTDAWNYPANNGSNTGYGGKVIYLQNTGHAVFTQSMIFDGSKMNPVVYDFDMGAVFDYNKDGVLDFLMADGNDSRFYYVFQNGLANVYNTLGTAESADLTPTLDGQDYAITQARISGVTQGVLGGSDPGLDVSYFLSNDDGQTWTYYAEFKGSAIVNAGAQAWFSFTTYGSRLRWMAVLSAPADSMPNYTNASYETPALYTINLDYIYVARQEYSRTSAAAEVVISGQQKELIIAATFMYPGWEGHLRAYDVTGVTMQQSTNSTIQTITSPNPGSTTGRTVAQGGTILWDAADLLNARSSDSRTIYAGYKASSGAALQLLNFTVANVTTLAPLLLDVNGDNAGLINFVRGQNRDPVLGDIQH
ncbi:MAG: VCBS repeat-containing protein, partial [Candidatus Aminicenantales bacterium]